MVAFGSGRGISVSANSAAGISPSVFPPRSTTTPCSVYATTLTSMISCEAAASCFSSNSFISLLISSEPAASSASAAASASAGASLCASPAGEAAGVSADATGPSGTGAEGAGVSDPASADSACSVTEGAVSSGEIALLLGAGAAAAAMFDGFSWSKDMFGGLQKDTSDVAAARRPHILSHNSLRNPY